MPEGTCSVVESGEHCPNPVLARGWCGKHYQRWRTKGTIEAPKARRFWAKVERDGPIPEFAPRLGPCWLWTGKINPKTGYGSYSNSSSHRAAWIFTNGPVPEGLQLDHLCRVRACCNPAHLEPVTRSENQLRGLGSGLRKPTTHCLRGHEYTPENTYRPPRQNHKVCLECKRTRYLPGAGC